LLTSNQYITIQWGKRNKDWYESKGYIFTKYNDEFNVKAEDLTKGSHAKVKVICDYCGKELLCVWKDYYRKRNEKTYACLRCKQRKTSDNNLKERQRYLYDKALEYCKENDYKIISLKDDIKTSNTRIKYICPKHGIQITKIYALTLRHGCKQCQYENQKLSSSYVKKVIEKYGGNILNPEDYIDIKSKNLELICPKCNQIFLTSYNSFISVKGQYCPSCSKSQSNGEFKISNFLNEHKINFISEYCFSDCKDINSLPFDFYLPEINVCIEYQGKQHYEPVEFFGGEERFKIQQRHDNIKKKYCKNNNIKFICIPYTELNNISTILESKLLI
jgi:hypothetical protein